jgi:hypothetical protein
LLDLTFHSRLPGLVEVHSHRCFHEVEWKVQQVASGDYPCADPVCVASYGEYLFAELHRNEVKVLRDSDVMDAADECESFDG